MIILFRGMFSTYGSDIFRISQVKKMFLTFDITMYQNKYLIYILDSDFV